MRWPIRLQNFVMAAPLVKECVRWRPFLVRGKTCILSMKNAASNVVFVVGSVPWER